LLKTLNFNKKHPFDKVFSQRYEIVFSSDKQTVTLNLPDFKSNTKIVWPERYCSFRITLVIAQMPDYGWVEAERRFMPVVEKADLLTETATSGWLPRSSVFENIILSASFPQPALQQPGTAVIVAIGVEVSNSSSGSELPGTGTMKIAACYV
jgi:hypothetical protein